MISLSKALEQIRAKEYRGCFIHFSYIWSMERSRSSNWEYWEDLTSSLTPSVKSQFMDFHPGNDDKFKISGNGSGKVRLEPIPYPYHFGHIIMVYNVDDENVYSKRQYHSILDTSGPLIYMDVDLDYVSDTGCKVMIRWDKDYFFSVNGGEPSFAEVHKAKGIGVRLLIYHGPQEEIGSINSHALASCDMMNRGGIAIGNEAFRFVQESGLLIKGWKRTRAIKKHMVRISGNVTLSHKNKIVFDMFSNYRINSIDTLFKRLQLAFKNSLVISHASEAYRIYY